MDRRVSSPARYRLEDRILFIVTPQFFAVPLAFGIADHYHQLRPNGVVAFLCAALAVTAIISAVVVVGLYLAEEKDEFQKAILTQSLLWSIGATFAVTTLWGCMEQFGHVPPMHILWVQLVFCIAFMIATAVNRWRYR